MYIKIINPKTDGKNAYSNTGSAAQAVNYLKKEAKEHGQEAAFFGRESEQLSGDEVTQMLDRNVKGLRAQDAKFYSLVISPSAAELAHIGNDDAKLRAYTRDVMASYGENFRLPNGKKLGAEDVVWAATRHDQRIHRGSDPEVTAGESKQGQLKEGLQTHIHVVVSARDADQKVTLNPMSKPDRFNRVEFAATSGALFTQRFGEVGMTPLEVPRPGLPSRSAVKALVDYITSPRPAISEEEHQRRARRIEERVERINGQLPADDHLDAGKVATIGRSRGYDKVFYSSLKRIELQVAEGRPPEQPYELLASGKVGRPGGPVLQGVVGVQQLIQQSQGERESRTQDIGGDDDEFYRRQRRGLGRE